jgi:hypothetical protein
VQYVCPSVHLFVFTDRHLLCSQYSVQLSIAAGKGHRIEMLSPFYIKFGSKYLSCAFIEYDIYCSTNYLNRFVLSGIN